MDNLASQGEDFAQNILISPDSTDKIDAAIIKSMVTDVFDPEGWSSITVLAQDNTLYCQLAGKDVYSLKFAQIQYSGSKVSGVTYEEYWPSSVQASDFYASCPNSSTETYWTTECTTISTAVAVIQNNHSAALSRGYNSTAGFGFYESLTNVKNYLSCSNLKMWGRVGHGYTGGLQLYGGKMLTEFSGVSLSGKGIYANSCKAYNNPFKDKVFNAGANWFISGISNLSIGPSEAVFQCWWGRAKNQQDVCTALNDCKNSSAGTIGCSGSNKIVPAPAASSCQKDYHDCQRNSDCCSGKCACAGVMGNLWGYCCPKGKVCRFC